MYKRRAIGYKTQRAIKSAGPAPSVSAWDLIQNDVRRAKSRNENQVSEGGSERSPSQFNSPPASQKLP